MCLQKEVCNISDWQEAHVSHGHRSVSHTDASFPFATASVGERVTGLFVMSWVFSLTCVNAYLRSAFIS